jgi:hypothetical protein
MLAANTAKMKIWLAEVDVVLAAEERKHRAEDGEHDPAPVLHAVDFPNRPRGRKGDHQDHRQEQDHVREIGQQRHAEGVDEAGDEAADEGADQASHAAEDHHDQRQRQHVRVEAGVGRHDRPADHAARAGERRAEAEHGGEEPRHRDADAARHLAVVDAGADHRPKPGLLNEEIQEHADRYGDDHHRQAIRREREPGDAHRLLQEGRRRHRDRIAAPDDEAEVGEDEGDAERHQNLAEDVAAQLPQDTTFPGDRRTAQRQGRKESPPARGSARS